MKYFDKDGLEIDRDTWGALFEKHDYRRIDHTMLDNGMSISTVWLGMQGGFGIEPYLFETMAFAPGSYEDMDVQRYHTMKEAQHGHQEMVNNKIDALSKAFLATHFASMLQEWKARDCIRLKMQRSEISWRLGLKTIVLSFIASRQVSGRCSGV